MQPAQVPQFIDIEDKVIGPLTLKQFGYIAGAAAIGLIFFFTFNFFFFLILTTPIAVLAFALAFIKPNTRPFSAYFKNVFFYLIKPRIFKWRKKETLAMPEFKAAPEEPIKIVPKTPKITSSKIKELASKVDIGTR